MNRPSISPININAKQKKNVVQDKEIRQHNNNTTKTENNTNKSKDHELKHVIVSDLYAVYLYYDKDNKRCKKFIEYYRIDPVLYDRVNEGLIKLYELKCPNFKEINGKFSLEPVCFTYTWLKYIEFEDRIQNT